MPALSFSAALHRYCRPCKPSFMASSACLPCILQGALGRCQLRATASKPMQSAACAALHVISQVLHDVRQAHAIRQVQVPARAWQLQKVRRQHRGATLHRVHQPLGLLHLLIRLKAHHCIWKGKRQRSACRSDVSNHACIIKQVTSWLSSASSSRECFRTLPAA